MPRSFAAKNAAQDDKNKRIGVKTNPPGIGRVGASAQNSEYGG
jgi:hypothetical protein